MVGSVVHAQLLTLAKSVHNCTGPLFALFWVLLIGQWAKDNLLNPEDWQWAKAFGGLLSNQEVPCGWFNFGEKFWLWVGVTLLGLTVAASGAGWHGEVTDRPLLLLNDPVRVAAWVLDFTGLLCAAPLAVLEVIR